MTVQSIVLNEVANERDSQDEKWGSQRALPDDTWHRILVEEVGEVAKALNDKEPTENLMDELKQVAAVAVAWVEALMCRKPGDDAPLALAPESSAVC